MRLSTGAMIALSVPCIINVSEWCILFAHPLLGFREDLKVMSIAIWIGGDLCAAGGVGVALSTKKSGLTRTFFIFSILVALLNVYGFFWCIGVVNNAWA